MRNESMISMCEGDMIDIGGDTVGSIIEAATCQKYVAGLTHGYYRYPARFSPQFARAVIQAFTQPGETVLDPFVGGGTSLVEAKALGRQGIGVDISELATFVSQVKSRILSNSEVEVVSSWLEDAVGSINLLKPTNRPTEWIKNGYQRNINCRKTWPIRKSIESLLGEVESLATRQQQQFARCAILKASQWALDNRKEIPSSSMFKEKLLLGLDEMATGNSELSEAVENSGNDFNSSCINRSAIGIEDEFKAKGRSSPKLILTSPPYPGVHMLYHRWQVQGRRETPAPFWIADCLDGSGEPYYTMGGEALLGYRAIFCKLKACLNHWPRSPTKKP